MTIPFWPGACRMGTIQRLHQLDFWLRRQSQAAFAACGDIVQRKGSLWSSADLNPMAGSIKARLKLCDGPEGINLKYGLLSCGPQSDPARVVGFPLAPPSMDDRAGNYFRPRGH